MVKMVEITSELIPNPLVKMVEKPLPHEDETYSPMLVRSTTGGPLFVSADKSGGDVANVTVLSTRCRGGSRFMKFMLYSVHKPGILK